MDAGVFSQCGAAEDSKAGSRGAGETYIGAEGYSVGEDRLAGEEASAV